MQLKLFKNVIFAMIVAAASVTLSGCIDNDDPPGPDDPEEAMVLDGIWQGVIEGNYYYDRWRVDDVWDTEIQFATRGLAEGVGKEVDYAHKTGKVYRSEFAWFVRNGIIYMEYGNGYRVAIERYSLYRIGFQDRFKGYFTDYYTGEEKAYFDLVKGSAWSRSETE